MNLNNSTAQLLIEELRLVRQDIRELRSEVNEDLKEVKKDVTSLKTKFMLVAVTMGLAGGKFGSLLPFFK